jgi:serine/threonine protein kinase
VTDFFIAHTVYPPAEVVLGVEYNTQADLWSAGCILYMLLSGYLPFSGKTHREIFHQIRAGNFCFHERSWANVSIPAKQLVVHLLTVNPQRRWTAEQALKSPWMTATAPALRLHENDLSEALSRIRARRRLKAAMGAVRWATTARFWNPERASLHQHIKDLDRSLYSTESHTSDSSGSTASCSLTGPPSAPRLSTGTKRRSFKDCYNMLQKVRVGDFATVWECEHSVTQEKFAVKVIYRAGLSAIHDEMVLNEVSILQSVSVDAPASIVRLNDFFEEEDAFFIVMELLQGGDVFDWVAKKSRYSERDARELLKQLLTAVEKLHSIGMIWLKREGSVYFHRVSRRLSFLGVAHRDIKPQNLLLQVRPPQKWLIIRSLSPLLCSLSTCSSVSPKAAIPTCDCVTLASPAGCTFPNP